MKLIILVVVAFALCLNSRSQDSTIYNKYRLAKFGIVFIPKELDTLNQTVAKNEIFEGNVERLKNIDFEKIKNKYNVNVTKSVFENASKEAYFFWPIKTMLNFLDPNLWGYDKDSTFGFDQSKIDYIPSVTLRKVPVKGHSNAFKKRYFDQKDTIRSYVKNIEVLMSDVLKDLYSEAKIESSSNYYLLENQYPVIRISLHISFLIEDEVKNFTQVSYMVFKNYALYSIKFEYKREEMEVWEKYIREFMTYCVFL